MLNDGVRALHPSCEARVSTLAAALCLQATTLNQVHVLPDPFKFTEVGVEGVVECLLGQQVSRVFCFSFLFPH